jgi:hypothetical protein
MKTKKNQKLSSVDSIKGMWNGKVNVQFLGEIKIHIGLSDAEKIQNGTATAQQIICKILQLPDSAKILGVIPDRAMKKPSSPFSK